MIIHDRFEEPLIRFWWLTDINLIIAIIKKVHKLPFFNIFTDIWISISIIVTSINKWIQMQIRVKQEKWNTRRNI